MFAVFGKGRPEEEKQRRLVLQQRRLQVVRGHAQMEAVSNARYQISPEYSSIRLAEEFQAVHGNHRHPHHRIRRRRKR